MVATSPDDGRRGGDVFCRLFCRQVYHITRNLVLIFVCMIFPPDTVDRWGEKRRLCDSLTTASSYALSVSLSDRLDQLLTVSSQ